jgi:hypothetical protein
MIRSGEILGAVTVIGVQHCLLLLAGVRAPAVMPAAAGKINETRGKCCDR